METLRRNKKGKEDIWKIPPLKPQFLKCLHQKLHKILQFFDQAIRQKRFNNFIIPLALITQYLRLGTFVEPFISKYAYFRQHQVVNFSNEVKGTFQILHFCNFKMRCKYFHKNHWWENFAQIWVNCIPQQTLLSTTKFSLCAL